MRTKNRSFRDHPNRLSLSLCLPLPCVHRIAAQCIFHGTTERVVPNLATDVWITYSHNHWASTETLRQLFSKIEGMVNEHTLGQDFAVLMDMGAHPHQCRDQTDAARGVRPHSRHHDPSTYNELLTALRCRVDASIQEHDSKDGL